MKVEEILEMTRSQVIRDTVKNNKKQLKHVVRGIVRSKTVPKKESVPTVTSGESRSQQDVKDEVGLSFI